MNVKSPEPNLDPKVFRGIQWGLVLLGLTLAVAVIPLRFFQYAGEPTRLDWFYLGSGGILFLLGLALDWIPKALSLFVGSTLVSLLIGFTLLSGLGVPPFETIDRLLLSLFPPKVGIWRFDSLFGYNHRPGSTGRFKKGSIDVEYHIDSEGFRVTPNPKKPLGRVVFLGGSFTFGTGVEDHEPYPYVCGEEYWTQYKIRNRAVTGWGTQHAYISLLKELEQADRPASVFYGWIAAHRERNYIRRSWVDHIGRKWGLTRNLFGVSDFRKHPHFEIEDDQLVWHRVVGPEDLVDNPPDLKEREIRLTSKMIEEMNRLCAENEIPFFLLNLPIDKGMNPIEESGTIEVPDYIMETVERCGIEYLNLQEAHRGHLPGDNHPNRETHREIARVLGERIGKLSPRTPDESDLAAPDS